MTHTYIGSCVIPIDFGGIERTLIATLQPKVDFKNSIKIFIRLTTSRKQKKKNFPRAWATRLFFRPLDPARYLISFAWVAYEKFGPMLVIELEKQCKKKKNRSI